ncbi:hypothetical protein DID73_00855 [Candidatus Marinamargulisbacteria bacterium SCGC AG-343-K17]|nr:hypothetical protein DID73_00855 [Candidatus Marinamargulisbacteria bacterium SCGC AG-343-K17]
MSFPKTINYKIISKGYDGDDFLLTNEEIKKTENKLTFLYDSSGIEISDKIKTLIQSLAVTLHKQTHSDRNNSYVEHEGTHSIRVAEAIIKNLKFVTNHFPVIINKLKKDLEIGTNKDLHFILITMALLHDCNYFVDKSRGEIKAIHALKSAFTAYRVIDEQMKRILLNKGLSPNSIQRIMNSIYDAILCHNGDKKSMKFNHMCNTPIGDIPVIDVEQLERLIHECLDYQMAHAFIASCITGKRDCHGRPCHKHPSYGIRFQDASLTNEPLLFLLRLADDFDSTENRLLPHQKSAIEKILLFTQPYMEERFMDLDRLAIGRWPWHNIIPTGVRQGFIKFTNHESNFINKIYKKDIYTHQPNESYPGYYNPHLRYFISLWLIESIGLGVDSHQLSVKVKIKQSENTSMQSLINFFATKVAKSDNPTDNGALIPLSDFYGRRILRPGMNLHII